ncbi:M3 family metallopeptidase, partial [Sphingomonas sp.]|uniref:M3 family metallopeptidase n=1 Tax=Sphingomonas sp. TaxID=28214 RepID=UPI003B3A382C
MLSTSRPLASAVAMALIALATPVLAANPLLTPSTLPFQAPRFDQIKDSDYQPAIEQGMAEQLAEITRIANSRAAPTFDNTIVAMEKSGRLLDRATSAFYGVVAANTNPTLDAVQTAVAPKLTQHSDAIRLNAALFQRVKTLHDKAASLKLTPEQAQLLKVIYSDFVQAGANLNDADKAKLRAFNTELATLETAYQQKLLAAAKAGALVVDDKAALAGLSEAEVAAAAKDAADRGLAGKYVLPLQNTTQQPLLQNLSVRATREALFKQSWSRAEKGDANDTRATLQQIAWLRAQKAKLLGFPTWAHYKLADQMAENPEAAKRFMGQLVPPLAARQKEEAAEIQAVIAKGGESFTLAPWDWTRYSEQVRKAKYDLDQNELKPYFELKRVLEDGVFFAAKQLYGLTFKRRTDIPVYQPDVMVYTVYEQDGSELGLMYFDYFKRDNKNGGAWMSNFVGQSKLLGTKPVIYNVGNFQKPAAGQPALVTWDDVNTMFHEFGHALHGLFADQVYPTISGTNTARDFVEFPSQFNEHWALEPRVLANYARHNKTGAVIPPALIEKIKRAESFGTGQS